jgi:hypothetical protein
VGVVVKHRQLTRQIGVFIEHPLENSMSSFNFTSTVLDESTTFIFGSWIYVTNGLGGFHSHLVDSRKSSDLDDLLLPDLVLQNRFRRDFHSGCTRPSRIGLKPI